MKKTPPKKPSIKPQILLLLLVSVLIAGAGWFFFSHSYKEQLPKSGTLAEDQKFPAEPIAAYKNLDLKIAAQAKYPGKPLSNVRDLGSVSGVKKSLIKFKVFGDNLNEYALVTKPSSPRPANGYPVIILCHGYAAPNRYSTPNSYLSDMIRYSKAGFVVIKPDFRGQGYSLHIGKPEGAYYSMAYNTDLLSLIADVKKTNLADSKNINLWGHSMGAYIALRAAVLSGDVKNLILLSGPVGYIADMYDQLIPISDLNNQVAYDIRQTALIRYGTPDSNPAFWNKTSPLNYLNRLKAYTQIYAGSNDSIVPPQFSADLDKALNAANKPHDYQVFLGGTHGLLPQRPAIYRSSINIMRPSS